MCSAALDAYGQQFQFEAHGTSYHPIPADPESGYVQNSLAMGDWLHKKQLTKSRGFYLKLQSPAVSEFFSGLVGASQRLEPLLSATEYRERDYLTVHSDMRPGASRTGGSRRLAFVLSLSAGHGGGAWPSDCGGRFVWCRPAAAVAPGRNSLTLFATSAWSTHLVEPVWSGKKCGEAGSHRFAWSGWFTTPSSPPEDSVDKVMPLGSFFNRHTASHL